MRLTLAITTYERPDALAAVLATVAAQSSQPDEVLIADDGSSEPTALVICKHAAHSRVPVRHVRQDHQGFRLTRLRNLAIAAAATEYIVFVDGDMLLHPEFVADHRTIARAHFFTQGVRVLLDEATTRAALQACESGRSPVNTQPQGQGLRRLYAWHSPRAAQVVRNLANGVIAIKGCNQGFWRADLERVNGFNEAIEGWGPEDKELCARLGFAGVRRQTLLFGGIAWHLAHAPAARDRQPANVAVLADTLRTRSVRAARGLDAHRSA